MDGFPSVFPSRRRFSCRTVLLSGIGLFMLGLGIGCGDFTLFGDGDQGICDPDPCASKDNATAGTCAADGESDYTCDCGSGYFWKDDGNTCEDPCVSDPCDTIENAVDGSCEGVSVTGFNCECESGYVWDGTSDSCRDDPCDPDPCASTDHATADTCTAAGGSDYTCDCDAEYFWEADGNTCEDPCASDPCDSIPNAEGGSCVGVDADDFICGCDSGYVWDGPTESCEADPCESAPCDTIANAVAGTCEPVGAVDYMCDCVSGHAWEGATKTCEADPCDPDPCEELDNAVAGTCEAAGAEDFTCDCGVGFVWNPQVNQCEITALGALRSGPYEFTVVEVSDGIFLGLLESILPPGRILDETLDIPSLDEVPVTRTASLDLDGGASVDLDVEIDQLNPSDDFYTLTGSGTGDVVGCTMVADGDGELVPETTTSVSVSVTLSNPVFTGFACDFVPKNPMGTVELILSGELQE